MLDPQELSRTASAFGVAEEQVRRDHLISHILAALASLDVPVVFFGGTALARTWLTDPANGGRLSEDIDLYTDQRQEIAQLLTRQLPIMLRREFPGSSWQPSLDTVRSTEPARLLSRDDIEVRIQLLSTSHHRELAAWPTDRTAVSLRYSDVDDVTLCVPTLTSFAAMKTAAWMDRATARDLYAGEIPVDVATVRPFKIKMARHCHIVVHCGPPRRHSGACFARSSLKERGRVKGVLASFFLVPPGVGARRVEASGSRLGAVAPDRGAAEGP